jgi:hypothetical protein
MNHRSLDCEQDRLSDHESDRKALASHDRTPARRSRANTATINGTAACSIATTALSTRLTAAAVRTLVSHRLVVPRITI